MKSVLFLCTGNYYRSRFAEVYFNCHAERRGLAWRAFSRGLALTSCNIGPISEHTMARLRALGIHPAGCDRMPLDLALDDLEAAHHVIAVKEAEHRPLMQRRFPEWTDRVEFWGVHDLDCAEPREAFACLESELARLLDRLRAAQDAAA